MLLQAKKIMTRQLTVAEEDRIIRFVRKHRDDMLLEDMIRILERWLKMPVTSFCILRLVMREVLFGNSFEQGGTHGGEEVTEADECRRSSHHPFPQRA